MKKYISKICAFALALCLASAPVEVFGFGNVSDFLIFNGSATVSDTVKNNLSLNDTFTDGCVFCKYDTGFDTYFFMCDLDTMYIENGTNGWKYYSNYNASGTRIANCHEYDGDASSRNYDFANISNNVTAQYVIGYNGNTFIICYTSASLTSGQSLESICQNSTTNDSWPTRLPAKRPDLKYCVVYPPSLEYAPVYGPLVGFPVGLDFSVEDFMQWLIDNDKVSVSVDTGGVSVGGQIPSYIGVSKLKSFLEFYKAFGSSNASFFSRIGSFFAYMNIVNQTNDNIIILKNTIDALYREYINSYKVEFYPDTANQAHHRRNINTQTSDDDLTLITDESNDDIYTTLLREIIRGIIALQSSTVSSANAIIDTLNNLDFSVNVANSGGSGITDFSDLYIYDVDAFNNDLADFQADIEDVQNVPQGYIDSINQNSLMPENMLQDKSSLTVNVPTITGFTVGSNGNTYSTQTGSYVLKSSDYPWLDSAVQKIKRFASILLILGYLVHLRYRIPELIRGE